MKLYKAYFRLKGKLDTAFVEAQSVSQVKDKIVANFFKPSLIKVVELKAKTVKEKA